MPFLCMDLAKSTKKGERHVSRLRIYMMSRLIRRLAGSEELGKANRIWP
ncbi:MAG: hypothetical protein ACI97A_001881 [Planctomycetota bacterium]|jgi:hypothetical protein